MLYLLEKLVQYCTALSWQPLRFKPGKGSLLKQTEPSYGSTGISLDGPGTDQNQENSCPYNRVP